MKRDETGNAGTAKFRRSFGQEFAEDVQAPAGILVHLDNARPHDAAQLTRETTDALGWQLQATIACSVRSKLALEAYASRKRKMQNVSYAPS